MLDDRAVPQEQTLAVPPRPLQLPEVLWQGLSETEQSTYLLAQRVLERMIIASNQGSGPEASRADRHRASRDIVKLAAPQHLAGAVRLLGQFGLISVEHEGPWVKLGLLATPEEHIRVSHPSGGHRWVFVARPVREPQVDPSKLN
jgi:hypothetical protein